MKVIGHNLARNFLSLSLGLYFIASPLTATARMVARTNAVTPSNLSSTQTVRGIENAGSLRAFYEALAAIREGRRTEPVRIAHYGDSHTAANILTAEVRRNFERDFGTDADMQARSRIIYD